MAAYERDLLKDLLTTPPEQVERVLDQVYHQQAAGAGPLTASSERALLRAAEAAGPITLNTDTPEVTATTQSMVEDVGDFVRRYPLVAVAAVAGAAYVLTRRRK